jgi:hypothetical protein
MEKQTPRPRKHALLWQSYSSWYEFSEMCKKHKQRLASIKKGESNMDAIYEQTMIDGLSVAVKDADKVMINHGKDVPVWDWVTTIKGLKSGSLPARLLAQIDDINKFDTVSKLWRFSGYAVIDGHAERGKKGEKGHYSRKLKSTCYLIADQFIRQQTPGYSDIYYGEKARQRELHPQAWCINCDQAAEKYKKRHKGKLVDAYRCPNHEKEHVVRWSDGHIHNCAWRKMIKVFLKDLWIEWRAIEGG